MNNRILVIHNPVAGHRRRRRLRRFLKMLKQSGHHVSVRSTTQRGDAREIARTANGMNLIIAAGGDGTVNETVDGLLANDREGPMPAVGFLPLGTANVLAWELGLPHRPRALLRMIQTGQTVAVRPGVANDHRFVLMVSAGIDARAVAAVKSETKRLLGGAAYVFAALRALRTRPPVYKVWIDGRQMQARTVIVTRARRYGGPFTLTPDAGLENDGLHVVMMNSFGLMAAVRYGFALVLGQLHKLSDVTVQAGQSVTIEGPNGDPVQMDGDTVGVLPLSISIEETPVPFLVTSTS